MKAEIITIVLIHEPSLGWSLTDMVASLTAAKIPYLYDGINVIVPKARLSIHRRLFISANFRWEEREATNIFGQGAYPDDEYDSNGNA